MLLNALESCFTCVRNSLERTQTNIFFIAVKSSIMSGTTKGNLPKNMKAVFWDGKPYHMTVKETPIAAIQTPNDAIVRVTLAAICGSDLHTYHGVWALPIYLIP